MQNHSDKWTRYAGNGEFWMDTRAVIGGVEYSTITAPVIVNGLLPGKELSVGNCISGTCTFTVMTNDPIPRSSEVIIKGRIIDEKHYTEWQNGQITESEAFSEWLEFGHFWVDKRTINDGLEEKLIDLECFDAMLKGNQAYSDNSQALEWPKPMQTVVTRIAEQMGVQIDSRTVIKTGADYIVYKPDSDKTLLDILRWIGEIHGGNWTITPDNKLRLVPLISAPSETFFVVDENRQRIKTPENDYLVSKSGDQLIMPSGIGSINVPVVLGDIWTFNLESQAEDGYKQITKVTMARDQEHVYTAGTDGGIEIKIQDNPSATQNLCNVLYSELNGLEYAPYEATKAVYDPTVELGDMIFIGSAVHSIIYTVNQRFDLTYNADVAAPGEEELDSEYPYISALQKNEYRVSATAIALRNEFRSEIQQTQDSILATVSETYVDDTTYQAYVSATSLTLTQHGANITAVQQDITAVEQDITSIEQNYTQKSEIRSQFALDPSNITLSAGVDEHGNPTGRITFNAGTMIVNGTNFSLDANGIMRCNGANINGEIKSEYEYTDEITGVTYLSKTEIAQGKLKLYRNNSQIITLGVDGLRPGTNASQVGMSASTANSQGETASYAGMFVWENGDAEIISSRILVHAFNDLYPEVGKTASFIVQNSAGEYIRLDFVNGLLVV